MKKVIYVSHPVARVHRADGMLAVSVDKQIVDRWSVEDISRVLVFGSAQLTTTAVHLLLRHRIPMFLLTRSGRLRGQIVPPEEGNIFLRMAQHARYADLGFRLEFAKGVVTRKIQGEVEIALRYGRNHPETSADLGGIVDRMRAAVRKVQDAPDLERVRGHEGDAAAAWFEAFGRMVKAPFVFERRSKHPAHNEVNALLNLGYTLLMLEVESRLEQRGFDPRVGYFHGLRYGRSSLALDVMESYRPNIHRCVLSVLNRRMLSPLDFEVTDAGIRLTRDALGRFVAVVEATLGDVLPTGKTVRSQMEEDIGAFRTWVLAGQMSGATENADAAGGL